MQTKEQLERLIALGKRRYIIRYGVIYWGLFTAVFYNAWVYYTRGIHSTPQWVLPFIIFPIGGIAFGAIMWASMNKRYAKMLAAESARDKDDSDDSQNLR